MEPSSLSFNQKQERIDPLEYIDTQGKKQSFTPYANDNRDISAQKGDVGYSPNDNGGHYANSNREGLSKIDDPKNKKYPNAKF
jgi:hypothetical protein